MVDYLEAGASPLTPIGLGMDAASATHPATYSSYWSLPGSSANHETQSSFDAESAMNQLKIKENAEEPTTWYHSMLSTKNDRNKSGPRSFEVRSSICVAGYNREAIQWVKRELSQLMSNQQVPLESFHIKHPDDLKDGSLLVPKVVMVATHCPGKKLIDEQGNQGQLDQLYDEVCDLGADIMVVYVGIPRSVYPPFRHMVYHPKMVDLLFPTQPLLREWAESNTFITVTENSDLTNMQKNVLREWVCKPIDRNHNMYQKVKNITCAEWSGVSSPRVADMQRSYSVPSLSEIKKKKKKSKGRTKKKEVPTMNLIALEEVDDDLELYNSGHMEDGAKTTAYL